MSILNSIISCAKNNPTVLQYAENKSSQFYSLVSSTAHKCSQSHINQGKKRTLCKGAKIADLKVHPPTPQSI